MMLAMVCRMAGVREVAQRCQDLLGTRNFSSLTQALCRASGVRFLMALIGRLESQTSYVRGELVALDSMALVIARTRRHKCEKYNDKTVGGGVLWSYRIKAPKIGSPVRLLKLIRGAWNDSTFMQSIKLVPDCPVYLMDRGFYSIDNISLWLERKVRFIIRVRKTKLMYEIVRSLTPPGKLKRGWRLELDAIVTLGSPKRRSSRPTVRLIIACNASGEQFIYATSENRETKSAQQVVDNYKMRWHIERFHRFMKEQIGLAHIYSYNATGLEFLLLTALLSAMLLFNRRKAKAGFDSITVLTKALRKTREELDVKPVWRRNIQPAVRAKTKASPSPN